MQYLYEMLESTKPDSILDAGCGEGFVLSFVAEQSPELRLFGVDLSEAAVSYAREHFGSIATFRKGNLYRLPFSDNSFDTVLCSEVLEHIEDPDRAVLELKRVARHNVLITVPHEPYFQWLNTLGRWFRFNPDAGHINFWTVKTFEQFMNKHFNQTIFKRKQLYQLALAMIREKGPSSGILTP